MLPAITTASTASSASWIRRKLLTRQLCPHPAGEVSLPPPSQMRPVTVVAGRVTARSCRASRRYGRTARTFHPAFPWRPSSSPQPINEADPAWPACATGHGPWPSWLSAAGGNYADINDWWRRQFRAFATRAAAHLHRAAGQPRRPGRDGAAGTGAIVNVASVSLLPARRRHHRLRRRQGLAAAPAVGRSAAARADSVRCPVGRDRALADRLQPSAHCRRDQAIGGDWRTTAARRHDRASSSWAETRNYATPVRLALRTPSRRHAGWPAGCARLPP